jgi:hypothetical protein
MKGFFDSINEEEAQKIEYYRSFRLLRFLDKKNSISIS